MSVESEFEAPKGFRNSKQADFQPLSSLEKSFPCPVLPSVLDVRLMYARHKDPE